MLSTISAQYQYNTFEIEENFPVTIEPGTDSLWQIGKPAKNFFNEASSNPNAVMTDSLNNYPIDQSTWIEFTIDEQTLLTWPYIQIEWTYKIDVEEGVDGGIIETSYDNGLTWKNVFSDPEFRPFVVGDYETDTLFNGQVGVTGVADWNWMAVCWGTYEGQLPDNPASIKVRYTFVSDSIDTQQEGWMLDDIFVRVGVIGNTTNQKINPISVHPNPTSDRLFLDLEGIEVNNISIQIYNTAGQLVHSKDLEVFMDSRPSISVAGLENGRYTLFINSEELVMRSTFLKME